MKRKDTQPPLAPHLKEIARVIRQKIDGRREGFGTANLVVRREVTKLAKLADTGRYVSHSKTFIHAMAALRGRELTRGSQKRALASSVTIIARWLELSHLLPPPEPQPKKKLPPLKRHKAIRRFRHNGRWLEEWGVEMGDRLLVAMTGDVKTGELAYVRITTHSTHQGRTTSRYYDAFHFVCAVDETCLEWARAWGNICLRNYGKRCMGRHDGERSYSSFSTRTEVFAYGRVCAVERDRRPVETTLGLRPYDEREGVTTALGPTPQQARPYYPKDGASNDPRLADLKRRLKDLGEEDDQIIRCTERYKLEKEIFDLEHPIDSDDWSAWEEGGER
jgi:hypothetical protein